jgi:uncharacterized SAM-binding protein YcdF (DUF218 family)
MEMTKRWIEVVFSPLGIMTILLALGILFSIARRHSRSGHRLLVFGGLLFFIFLFSPLSLYLNWRLERQFQPMLTPPESPKISKIVVLSGYAEEHSGIPITSNVSAPTMSSLTEGLRLYRLVPGAKLIVSGGVARAGDTPVAALMAAFLQKMGVPATDVIVEGSSRNTYENLVEVKEIVGADPFILVAAACDLKRAVAVSKRLQMDPVPAPSCIWTLQNHPRIMSATEQLVDFSRSFGSPSLKNLFRLQWAYHEYLGYMWYQLIDRI